MIQRLDDVLDGLVELEADRVTIEWAQGGIEVTMYKGSTGIGGIVAAPHASAIVRELVSRAKLENRNRGLLKAKVRNRHMRFTAKEYDYFGESAVEMRDGRREVAAPPGACGSLGAARLQLQAHVIVTEVLTINDRLSRDCPLAHEALPLIQPDGTQVVDSDPVWFCDAHEEGVYRWYELAFMISPLIDERSEVDPFFLDPKDPNAGKCFTPVMTDRQLAWQPTAVDQGEETTFSERWLEWFGAAATNSLDRQRSMPESSGGRFRKPKRRQT